MHNQSNSSVHQHKTLLGINSQSFSLVIQQTFVTIKQLLIEDFFRVYIASSKHEEGPPPPITALYKLFDVITVFTYSHLNAPIDQ